jgi:hypothetical protein
VFNGRLQRLRLFLLPAGRKQQGYANKYDNQGIGSHVTQGFLFE